MPITNQPKLTKNLETKILKEFKSLEDMSKSLYSNSEFIPHEEQSSKNRYASIIPYKSTIATVDGLPYDNKNYFNGNYIRNKSGKVQFIACQGPLSQTTDSFWKVVIRNKCSRIVGWSAGSW